MRAPLPRAAVPQVAPGAKDIKVNDSTVATVHAAKIGAEKAVQMSALVGTLLTLQLVGTPVLLGGLSWPKAVPMGRGTPRCCVCMAAWGFLRAAAQECGLVLPVLL